jgi:hypothetical protein
MNTIRDIIETIEYKKNLQTCFEYLGYSLVDNEIQTNNFNDNFKNYGLSEINSEDLKLKNILNKTYWFWKSEDDEFFGVLSHPNNEKEHYIINIDTEWTISIFGFDLIDWIEFNFEDMDYKQIPEQIILFKKLTKKLNQNIHKSAFIEDDSLFCLF